MKVKTIESINSKSIRNKSKETELTKVEAEL